MQINPNSTLNSLGMFQRAQAGRPHRAEQAAAQAQSKPVVSVSDGAPGKPVSKPAPSISDVAAGSGTMIECGPAMPTVSSTYTSEDTLTIDGLCAAWGQTKSPYDLTGNGIVDVDDLLAFINGLNAPAANDQSQPTNAMTTAQPESSLTTAAPESTLTTAAPAVALTAANPPVLTMNNTMTTAPGVEMPTPPLTLNGFEKTWGQADPNYDLNNDGTVNVDDLLAYINGLSNGPGAPEQAIGPDQSSGGQLIADKAHELKLARAGINTLADTLIDRLIGAGFDQQPPTNVRELVDKLQLSPRDSNHLFKKLGMKYPRGLGVNMVG